MQELWCPYRYNKTGVPSQEGTWPRSERFGTEKVSHHNKPTEEKLACFVTNTIFFI
jgi:hypothetical protein